MSNKHIKLEQNHFIKLEAWHLKLIKVEGESIFPIKPMRLQQFLKSKSINEII